MGTEGVVWEMRTRAGGRETRPWLPLLPNPLLSQREAIGERGRGEGGMSRPRHSSPEQPTPLPPAKTPLSPNNHLRLRDERERERRVRMRDEDEEWWEMDED